MNSSASTASCDIPEVESPYAGRRIRLSEYLAMSAMAFGVNFHWGALILILMPREAKGFSTNPAVIFGLVIGLGALVATVAPLFVGALTDRCAAKVGRRRPYLIWGVAINLLGLLAMYAGVQAGSLALYIAAFVIVQLGNNVATTAFSSLIPDLAPPGQRGPASGWMTLFMQLGTLLGALGIGLFMDAAGPAAKYAAVGLLLTLFTAFTVLGIRETPLPYRPAKVRWGSYLRSLWIDPKKYPNFAWVWVMRAAIMMGFYAIMPFVQFYFTDMIGVERPERVVGGLIGGIMVGSATTGLLCGAICERWGLIRVNRLACLGMAVFTIPFIFCRSVPQVLFVGILFGLAYGAFISANWTLGTSVLPSRSNAAKEMAVWHVAMTLPQTVAGPIAGVGVALFGQRMVQVPGEMPVYHYTPAGYAFLFSFATLCFGLSLLALAKVRLEEKPAEATLSEPEIAHV